jgi:lysine-N-methylase
MSLPIRSLPIVEHWDCHSCARCCRDSIIPLTAEDLAKIESQRWHEHPDLRNTKTVTRLSFTSKRRILAKRRDGSCVFLMSDGLCRIHVDHGLEAKPIVCQMVPLQLVPQGTAAYLTLRRSCPSAAASRGRRLEDERSDVRRLLRRQKDRIKAPLAPRLTRKVRLPWKDLERVLRSISRLMTDSHYPVVRRVVHTLLLCDALEQCDPRGLNVQQQSELMTLLEESVLEGASPFFRDRKPPNRSTAGLFRQSAFHLLRLHPAVQLEEAWSDRLMLARATLRFLWGRGAVPTLGSTSALATFEQLEEPLGPLEPRVMAPLNLFLETAGASGRYAVLRRPGWTTVDGFRSLALTYVAGMWLARLLSRESEPTRDMMVDIVVALDRGQGFATLTNSRHRRRVRALSLPGQLASLVAWYAQ